jgi:hypothetical protein
VLPVFASDFPAGEISAVVTAVGMSLAAIITAIAALRNANANAARVDDLIKENDKLHAENNAKTAHNEHQDAIILDQQVKIQKWHEWGVSVGRMLKQMQLQIGEQARRNTLDTLPLKRPALPDERNDDER